jgi:hypothetical protein
MLDKKIMICKHCHAVNQTVHIQSPHELIKAIHVIRDNLDVGTLRLSNYWPLDQVQIDEPTFYNLPEHGPWPDYVCYFFQCPECLSIFNLSVETYHGFGGKWQPIAR